MVPKRRGVGGRAADMEVGAPRRRRKPAAGLVGCMDAGGAGHPGGRCPRPADSLSAAAATIGPAEVRALAMGDAATDRRDGPEKLLDYLFVMFRRAEAEIECGRPLEEQVMAMDPDARIALACFFDAQRIAEIAADDRQPAWRRATAARVLDAGATQFYHLCFDGETITLGEACYLIVQEQKFSGHFLKAVESLHRFTGVGVGSCARAVRDCFGERPQAAGEGGVR